KVAGAVTTLWEDSKQCVVGHLYMLTLDCVGDQLTGYLDAVPLFNVNDADIPGGTVALYCWKNSGVTFAEVRVSAPAWMDYYTFGEEAMQPAGTKLRVYSGNAAAAPAAQGGVLQRFAATLSDAGDFQFGADFADLRITSPTAQTGHY